MSDPICKRCGVEAVAVNRVCGRCEQQLEQRAETAERQRDEAFAALRWVYENGMQKEPVRPKWVSEAFSRAYDGHRAALNATAPDTAAPSERPEMLCPACDGTRVHGNVRDGKGRADWCKTCGGAGRVPEQSDWNWKQCTACKGRGERAWSGLCPCEHCNTSGRVPSFKTHLLKPCKEFLDMIRAGIDPEDYPVSHAMLAAAPRANEEPATLKRRTFNELDDKSAAKPATPSDLCAQARADERERCARVAFNYRELWSCAGGFGGHSAAARIIGNAIRAGRDGGE